MTANATIELMSSGVKYFYRSGKGNRAHAQYGCIASRRSIWWGEIQAMTVEQAQTEGWTGCGHCCAPEDHVLLAEGVAPAVVVHCPNSGVTKPGRLYSTCRNCGKEGKVNRTTGRIRAHLPLAAFPRTVAASTVTVGATVKARNGAEAKVSDIHQGIGAVSLRLNVGNHAWSESYTSNETVTALA